MAGTEDRPGVMGWRPSTEQSRNAVPLGERSRKELKQYHKEGRALRTETTINDTRTSRSGVG
jgi:hypothetical protein